MSESHSPRFPFSVRVIAGALVAGVGLVLAGLVGEWLDAATDVGDRVRYAVQAVVMSGFVVPVVWVMRTRLDGRPMSSLGLPGPRAAASWFLVGLGLVAVPMLVTLVLTLIFGWADLNVNTGGGILTTALLTFVIAFFFEALPEELVFRGYVFGTLTERFGVWASSAITVVLFAVLPLFVSLFQNAFTSGAMQFGGSDSIQLGYMITMVFFGAFQQVLRVRTGTVWTCIGFHVAFLQMDKLIGPEESAMFQFLGMDSPLPVTVTLIGTMILLVAVLVAYPRLTKDRDLPPEDIE